MNQSSLTGGLSAFFLFLSGAAVVSKPAYSDSNQVSGANCSFIAHREQFLAGSGRARQDVAARVAALDPFLKTHANSTALAPLAHRNFIDDLVFAGLTAARVAPAPLTTDEEFLRRITLDLTGRIPSAADVRAFLADPGGNKRDVLIDKLLYSDEYVDKWTMWLGDLLQNVSAASNVSPGFGGRDAFYNYLHSAIANGVSFRDLAMQVVTATGDTSDFNAAPTNFIYRSQTPMGPVQDSFDTTLARTADIFLGSTYHDCLLCHSGRGHLDAISLWGSQTTRQDAQSMAAFFSRLNFNMPRSSNNVQDALYNSWRVAENNSSGYALNTNYGNRPTRAPYGPLKTLTPVYKGTGAVPATGQNWREAFGNQMIGDRMFARNFANRMFKQFFNLGLVDPVDTMDPARLDPAHPPAAPWTLQAAIPALLERLADEAATDNFDMRAFMRTLVQSNAYQLSSRYDAAWSIDYIPLFARHYPRRIDAEEVHDAIVKATGIPGNYNVNGAAAPPIQWAMQLPDPLSPSGAGTNLLNNFLRGNRDTAQRNSTASILQRLSVMNDSFVTGRTKVAASPELLAVSKMSDPASAVEELFLAFLSREPTDAEKATALSYLTAANTAALKNAAIEDLAWALINKIDFLYSY